MRIRYTHIMMPNRTIYVKDADLPLFEQAQELLGDSVSAAFADFLKERVGKLKPEERMRELVTQINHRRDQLRTERGVPSFVDAIFAEATAYGQKSLKALKAQQTRRAKAFFYAATTYHQRAERPGEMQANLRPRLSRWLASSRLGGGSGDRFPETPHTRMLSDNAAFG